MEAYILDVEQLAAKLDQPWCKGNLCHIEKISAVLSRLDRMPKGISPLSKAG